jgi:uncharacterized protein (TIGR00251 family)
MSEDTAIRDGAEGALISCHVQPRASRTRLVGRHGDALKIQVAAPPVEGAANRELVGFFRKRLGCPAGAVSLKTGEQGRRKVVLVRGMSAAVVAAALASKG